MSSEMYVSLGGTEISNAERFSAYTSYLGILHGLQGCPCPDLAMVLGDVPYTCPKDDLAAWYDPAVPESADFAGVWIQEMTGIAGSTITREFTRSLTAGAVPGPAFDGERVVSVTAYIAAASEAALSYGLGWLASSLRGSTDCSSGQCIGDELCFLSSCPDTCGSQNEMTEAWEAAARFLFDVALVSGPILLEKRSLGRGCGSKSPMLAKIEWTMTAGVPWVFSYPRLVAEGAEFTAPVLAGEGECDVVWIPAGECPPADECPTAVGCVSDPMCTFPMAPQPPQTIDKCSCVSRVTSAHVEIEAPPGVMPRWLDMVPYIEVTTGDVPMRRLTVRFYQKPLADSDCDDLDECLACGEISFTYAPRDATIVLDGRTQRAKVICAGGATDDGGGNTYGPPALVAGPLTSSPASSSLLGANGGPPSWPVFTCNTGLCIQVLVDGDFYSSQAQVSVSLVSRQDAA